ncbi:MULTISPECIES: DUF4099 domain-containing protein [Bacteroides]|uniref:DUF4099 domain-containing protein n=1 Tax=Bacteroides TaxID=816 RepID=UPI001CAA5697|nr:DUF3945 domain-containing protein [Bacteroides fragilis]MBY2903066.1 hypothetical protein [Bacteroides fragilis]
MEENQNEEEVLLVADKDDDGKLKAVDKSAAKEGIWRLLLPSMENLDDFLKVNKQSSILEDFFLNFRHQFQQPTDFPFYRIPASLLDTLDVFTDMLRHPEENKAFIDLYKINPNDYPILAQEQESPSETAQQSAIGQQPTDGQQPVTEQQAQPLGFENRVDWEQLARLGITRQSLEQGGDLSAVLSGGKSGLVTISTEIEGISITTQGRIHFQEGADGKLDLKIDCYRREPALDLPFHGVLLDKETRDNILATGNAGHPVLLPLDGSAPKPCLVSLDRLTNNLVAVPVDDILIPMEIKGVTLTPEQHRQLSEGGKVLIEGMDSQWKSKFDAYMQYNVAKEKFDYNFDGLDRNRYKKMEQQQKASAAQTDGVKFFIPKKLLGKELTPEQQEKFGKMETIYVTGMKDRDGQPFNAYVRMNLDRSKPDFFRYNPDKAKSQAREITPTADHKTQVAVNNGATDEATRHVQRPLKPAAAQAAQVEAAKQEGKKEVKKKSGKGRKL